MRNPPWSITQADTSLHVELASGAETADLEKLLDALGAFSHGFSSVSEIVFHLPSEPLADVVTGFLEALVDTVRGNGVEVRFDPEMR